MILDIANLFESESGQLIKHQQIIKQAIAKQII